MKTHLSTLRIACGRVLPAALERVKVAEVASFGVVQSGEVSFEAGELAHARSGGSDGVLEQ